ncbi:hypothetical protein IQ243_06475 [Nostocales cyanobacterium LEGE 11386]|nr:hypothetical protein [Nostocales cyanobacterium LEGE 11386]
MKKDEAINQIRKIRHIISEEYGHDPKQLVNCYLELQKQYPHLAKSQNQQTELASN